MLSGIIMEVVWGQFNSLTSFSASNPIFIVLMIFCFVIIATATTRPAVTEEDLENKAEKVKGFRPPLKDLIQPSYLWGQFKSIFTDVQEKVLSNFVGALYIISYRHEWGKYRKYDTCKYELRKKFKTNENRKSYWTNFLECFGFVKSSKISEGSGHLYRKTKKQEKDLYLDHNHNDCQLITINVSGLKFVTQVRTLNHFPDSLLGNEALRAPFYDPLTMEYFFDRNRKSFEGVMYFYQSGGILKKPNGVPADVFLAELAFFQMKDALKKSKKLDAELPISLPKHHLTRKIWLLFEHPDSSPQAKMIAVFSIMAVVFSIFTFCAVTLPGLAFSDTDEIDASRSPENDNIFDRHLEPFFILDTACICWFVFEVVMRTLSCPKAKDFFSDIMNIIDVVAIMPYIINLIVNAVADIRSQHPHDKTGDGDGPSSNVENVTTVLKVARLVRVFKLSRHSSGLKVLGSTLKASVKELSLLILFLLIGVVFFSSIMYFAEESQDGSPFQSIPDGFWWSIVTMTTVGYGDIVPIGNLGKLVGALCALVGVLTLALPVPIVGSNFEFYYHSRSSIKKKVEYIHVDNCPNRNRDYVKSKIGKTEKDTVDESESDSDFEQLKYLAKDNANRKVSKI